MADLSEIDYKNWGTALQLIPDDPQEFLQWIQGPLKKFFPFENIYCAYAEITLGQINIIDSISSGHSPEYLEQIESVFNMELRGALSNWLRTRAPFFIEPDIENKIASNFELEEIKKFNLKNVVAHGVIGIESNYGTYFSFSGIQGQISNYHIECLKIICPVLNDLFIRYLSNSRSSVDKFDYLTERQKVIARLVARGLDDKSIAKKIFVSEKTVRNQLTLIYAKMGIHKRTQLIGMVR